MMKEVYRSGKILSLHPLYANDNDIYFRTDGMERADKFIELADQYMVLKTTNYIAAFNPEDDDYYKEVSFELRDCTSANWGILLVR